MAAKRAVLYARVSSDDTKKDGRNLSGQVEMCRLYAQSKGWRIIAELSEDDRGASGAELDLPQLNKAIEMAHGGTYDVLVMREIDRFARKLSKQLVVEDELRRAGVEIEYVLGEYPDTPEGNLMKHVKATIAEYEREKINERMTRGRHQKIKSGSVLVSERPPYGYRVVKDENGKQMLVIHEEEAEIVRLIFTWYTKGDETGTRVSLRQIARRLTDMGVPTYADTHHEASLSRLQKWPGVWCITSIHGMLKSEVYTGIWRYGKTTKRGKSTVKLTGISPLAVQVPAIVDVDTWQIALAQLEKNKEESRRNRKYEYLLSQRVNCGSCGGKMHGSSASKGGKLFTFYYCNARRFPEKYTHTCNGPAFQPKYVDPAVWQWLKSILTDPDALALGLRAQQAQSEEQRRPMQLELSKLEKLIEEKRRQVERLLDLYLESSVSKDEWVKRKAQIDRTLEGLEGQRNELHERLTRQTVTDEQIHTLQAFAYQIGDSIEKADMDFSARRCIIEILNVRATLYVNEQGTKYVHASCVLGKQEVCIVSNATRLPCWQVAARHRKSS